jgi:polyferredoxin
MPLNVLPGAPAALPTPEARKEGLAPGVPRARWIVQGLYVAFLLAVGLEFARFVSQATSGGPLTAPRPPAVEAFLPISALLGLERFLLTRYWDEIHPAGLTVLVAAIATAWLARKAFCAWVCPVGAISRGLEWLGTRTLWRRRKRWPAVPAWLDLPLTGTKYLLLAFFVWTVASMPLDAIEAFLRAPYNAAADAKMLALFVSPSATTLWMLAGLAGLSLVVKSAWCRWLCPYGALLGLASWVSPLAVRRDPLVCNDCRACTRACPAGIAVHLRGRVSSPECTGCLGCVSACTTPGAIALTLPGHRGVSPWVLPAVALGTMLGAWGVARLTGFWETALPAEAFRLAYALMGVR